ncbi:hypothetical protein H8E88_17035 [candidate division KSB1 bacterium]|nr:hypothetical protein [candidate division KSB1 bacterium]
MKKINFIILITFLCFSKTLISQPVKGKWGVSASLSPWTFNREMTISKNLSKKWTILLWGDFSFDKNDTYYRIENGQKFSVGPEIRKKIYYLEKYKIAPYCGLLMYSGYEKYDRQSKIFPEDKHSRMAIEAGLEFTFGVEYFFNEHISLYIHSRFLRYQYQWIDVESYNAPNNKYKARYQLIAAGNVIPALFIRFFF